MHSAPGPEGQCELDRRRHGIYDDVDISVAVAIPDGLITPIIRRADQKGLLTISREMRDLAARARSGKLKPEEFQGGGFSISNMGMFGVSSFRDHQSATGRDPGGRDRAETAGGEKRRAGHRHHNDLHAVSVDHRVVDGALGARWLREFKTVVEDPLSLML